MPDLKTYVSIHAIHTYPYANLNRDDLGSPKSLLMGGANRMRISSQCLKRSVRRWAEEEGDMTASIRTREITNLIRAELEQANLMAERDREAAAALIGKIVESLSGSGDQVLAFFGRSEIAKVVELAAELEGASELSKSDIKKRQKELTQSVEQILSGAESGVALFGRMFADTPKISVDGAVQVAHAFTVHESAAELDYFTAVEDWVSNDSHSGAGHLNTNEFAAGTFYKYANVGIGELLRNVDGDATAAGSLLTAFVRGFVLADPSGKQTSTAARTLPDLIYVAVESQRPVSLASAFEQPIKSRDGYRGAAIERLDKEAAAVSEFLGAPTTSAHASITDTPVDALGERVSTLDDLVGIARGTFG